MRGLDVPPLSVPCRMTVTIPARNEETLIGRALEALARQPEAPEFDVILFANNCTDATARVARGVANAAPALQLHVVEALLPSGADHVGVARRLVMDCAAARFLAAGRSDGIVATTDADTVVAANWAAQTFAAMRSADAVAGFVEIGSDERAAMSPAMQRMYQAENDFRAAWAELEAIIDPRPEDPAPRHCSFVGASLAVNASTYVRAGGVPAVPALEDRAFFAALRRIDARVRHSIDVRAATSARRRARVQGGFATLVSHLDRQASAGRPFLVEHPQEIVDELEERAALRRLHAGIARRGDVEFLTTISGMSPEVWRGAIDSSVPFGEVRERLRALADAPRRYDMLPVEAVIAALREAIASRKAAAPTRNSAASGAG